MHWQDFLLTNAHNREMGDQGPVAAFLAAWQAAASAYETLIAAGIPSDDLVLARDQNYRRLLASGQAISWIGGEEAVKSAAQMIARQTPEGNVDDFARLWRGLMPPQFQH
jgi:hypothetical protein